MFTIVLQNLPSEKRRSGSHHKIRIIHHGMSRFYPDGAIL